MPPHTSSPANQQGDGEKMESMPELVPSGAGSHEGGCEAPGSNSNPQAPPNSRRTTARQNAKDKEAPGQLKAIPSNASSVGLDSLSTQIYLRTNSHTEPPTIAQRLRNPGRSDSPSTETTAGQPDASNKPPNSVVDATKDWRKGTSFLSRLSMRTPWARDDDAPDSDSEMGDLRDDGAHAQALTSVVGAGGGYIPFYKEPPRYIKVKTHHKKVKEFNRLFLAQELSATNSDDEESCGRAPTTAVGRKIMKGGAAAIWSAEFSVDGKYLAVGGKDNVVRVYAVISTPEDRKAQEEDEAQNRGNGEKLSAPVFRSKAVREFEGHGGEVLALSWSKNGFLLSASMDKTVKLWLPTRGPECLCTFKHSDIVTSIAFHPTDDRFFLAGSLDARLRLWSIPDKAAAFSTETSEFITAVGFSPDGKTAICGLLSGMCIFYNTSGLETQFQIHVRSSRGKNAKGSKITGIRAAQVDDGTEKGDVKVLISSNDSRVRVYSLKTRMLEAKFRGLVNQSSQIHARFSEDAGYIICGSEDRKAYIWGPASADAETKDKQPYECFDAHPEVVTVAVMAPTKSKQLLSASGDPIYDLCNPPPVKLVSLDESQTVASEGDSVGRNRQESNAKRPEESPAYIERSKHHDGNIIVTTDRTGTIKVFRQDCAASKRQQNMWETGSKFSGKLAGGVGRSASIRTKASATSRGQSRRGSLNLGPHPAAPQLQPASDRIISWRQDVDGLRPSRNVTPTRSERSASPTKAGRSSINNSATNLASESRKEPYMSSPGMRSTPASPASSTHTNRTPGKLAKGQERTPVIPPTPSFNFLSIAESKENKGEGGFWSLGRRKGGSSMQPSNSLAPGGSSGSSGRKSMGPVEAGMPAGPSRPTSARSNLDDDGRDGSLERLSAKQRVDSGVGRLSAESTMGAKAG